MSANDGNARRLGATRTSTPSSACRRTRAPTRSRRPTEAGARQPPRLPPRGHRQAREVQEVAEAYDVVGDPEKRKKYDEMREL